jgi:hypothetical protein
VFDDGDHLHVRVEEQIAVLAGAFAEGDGDLPDEEPGEPRVEDAEEVGLGAAECVGCFGEVASPDVEDEAGDLADVVEDDLGGVGNIVIVIVAGSEFPPVVALVL